MSHYRFILGPNGVEEVFMREEDESDEKEDDQAPLQTVTEPQNVQSPLENGQRTLSPRTRDLTLFKGSQTGRIVTAPASEQQNDHEGQPTEDITVTTLDQLEAVHEEVIVPIVPEQSETVLESSENETIVRNNLQKERNSNLTEEFAELDTPKDNNWFWYNYLNNVPEQSVMERATYFIEDSDSSDSDHDECVKVKPEDNSVESSASRRCDESASSVIATQHDSDFEVENVENIEENQLPPSLEFFGAGEIVSRAFLDIEMPILERQEQLDLPSAVTLPLLPRLRRRPTATQPKPKPKIPSRQPQKFFSCTKCPSTFAYASVLSRHSWNVHGDVIRFSRPFSCYFCARKYPSNSELEVHMPIHTMERSHRCPLCPKDFNRKSILQGHMARIHAPKGPRVKRVPLPKKFLCPTCGKGFEGSSNLKSHVDNVHLKLKPWKCELCDAKFGRKEKLAIHKLSKHTKKRNFACDLCGKKYFTKDYVKSHVQMVHKEKRHECPHCEKTFTLKIKLQAHNKKAHTDKAPSYPCEAKECGKSFILRKYRDAHVKRFHEKKRPFKCQQKGCKKAFATFFEQKSHSASHMNGRPYGCDECESAFKLKDRLRAHLRNVHKYSVQDARKAVDEVDLN